jgi:hypothetical protein
MHREASRGCLNLLDLELEVVSHSDVHTCKSRRLSQQLRQVFIFPLSFCNNLSALWSRTFSSLENRNQLWYPRIKASRVQGLQVQPLPGWGSEGVPWQHAVGCSTIGFQPHVTHTSPSNITFCPQQGCYDKGPTNGQEGDVLPVCLFPLDYSCIFRVPEKYLGSRLAR